MRAAAIFDIHGNLPALEAVLEHVHREGVDLPLQFIRGKGDRAVLEQLRGQASSALPERIRRTGYPMAEEFAPRNVLQPPSEAEMPEAFGQVAGP